MGAGNVFRQCVRYVLQLLLLVTVGLFLVYLSAISLNAWWLSRAQELLGEHLNFPYLSPYVAKRFDKADKYFAFPLSEDLALAVSLPLFTHSVPSNKITVTKQLELQLYTATIHIGDTPTVQVWAFWGLTLVASLLALALKALPSHTPDESVKRGRMPKWRLTDAVGLFPWRRSALAWAIQNLALGRSRFIHCHLILTGQHAC